MSLYPQVPNVAGDHSRLSVVNETMAAVSAGSCLPGAASRHFPHPSPLLLVPPHRRKSLPVALCPSPLARAVVVGPSPYPLAAPRRWFLPLSVSPSMLLFPPVRRRLLWSVFASLPL